jgi:two-component system sensor histidine kinase/response regulator
MLPITDASPPNSGAIPSNIMAVNDTPPNQTMEEALRESEERYRMLLDGVQDYAIFAMDLQGRIVSWHAGAQRIKGYTAEEIVGRNFSCFFPPADVQRGRPEEVLRLTAATGRHEELGMRVRKDGSQFLARLTFTTLRDAAGKLRGFSEFSHDLSESKESGAKYRGLLEAAPDAMVVVNAAGEIVLLNVQAEKQFGYRRDELIGQKVTNIVPEGFAERLIADGTRSAAEALAQHMGTGIELSGRRQDGSEFPIEIMLSPLESAEGVLVTAAIRDISVRKRAEQQILDLNRRLGESAAQAGAANRAKSTFLSTMSHEIRTPMNAILGYAQLMLREKGLRADMKANLEIIGRSGEHLLSLINDVLDMSKIDAGRIELDPVTFNLSKVLEDLADMFQLRAAAKALRFERAMDGESVPYILADEGKIRQALINLVGNAVKFTEHGQVKLHVTLDRRDADKLWLSACVEDTGPGISEEEQQKLFEAFTQARRGRESQEGTGLGLAISRQFARLMGGDLTVSSSLGEGSIFRFEVPIEIGDAAVAIRRNAPRRVMGIRAGTQAPRILVVDDRLENRDWLMKLLTAIGFSVRMAENGAAAIRTWEEWSPRLILMDVHMPGMNGIEATRRIKADPRGKDTVIVTLTASALNDDRLAAMLGGADDFLAKPCRDDELLEKMRPLLGIAYDYEEAGGTESIAALEVLTAERLRQLPSALVAEIRGAIRAGNKKLLNKLIRNVGQIEDLPFACSLQALADKYEYVALTRLLEEACL